MDNSGQLQRTSLFDEHVAAGGRMVEFAGYELPVQYTGLSEEHEAVRTRAGLFDVSHMGEIAVRGPGAFDFVQLVSCNDHTKMVAGRAQYTGLMLPEATFVDDILVHKMADDDYLLVVNAAMLALVAALLPGMHVSGFWAAFWGALVVSIVSWIGSMVFGPKGRIEVRVHRD